MTTRKINAILRNAGIQQRTQTSMASSGFSSERVNDYIWIGYYSSTSLTRYNQRMTDIQDALAAAGIPNERRGHMIVVKVAA